ncbi:hypothetical protein [Kitasatospora sp. NPDC057015]|uniref:hypothetical protein n=1 Tax=Kitasatospora sp. NPDC057015 TaxID=3346001 RepID=UPI00364082C9
MPSRPGGAQTAGTTADTSAPRSSRRCAAGTGRYDPQALKRLWHCPPRFGTPHAG